MSLISEPPVEVEVLPDVWQVRQDLAPVLVGTYTVVNVLVGDRLLLIDTGLPDRERDVLDLIARLGRRPRDVAAILNTHGHGDHIGANVALARATGAPAAIHRDDAFYLELGGQKWGDTPIPTVPADRLLKDGDVLAFGEHRLEVVHLPGHSPGSVGYYDRDRRILYGGDSIQGRGTVVQHLPLYVDPDAYARTLERVRAIPLDHLVLDHPYLPLPEAVVSGAAIAEFLDVSQQTYDAIDPLIRETLAAARRPLTSEEIALPLCRWNGFPTTTGMATTTVKAHLERLARLGDIAERREGNETRWE
jgi:glyoxylase-like metal-dependent hydrolase (beta-lactamase superfamily II)